MNDGGDIFASRKRTTKRMLELNEQRGTMSPISAAVIAASFGGNPLAHEVARRRVREIVASLREDGQRICANGDGYWIARDDGEWKRYCESRAAQAKFEFVVLRTMKQAANDKRTGQEKLFDAADEGSRMAWARN
jgi:hypothetical protein